MVLYKSAYLLSLWSRNADDVYLGHSILYNELYQLQVAILYMVSEISWVQLRCCSIFIRIFEVGPTFPPRNGYDDVH